MVDVENMPFPALTRQQRLRCLAGIVVVGVLFLSVATRTVLVPVDPEGAVSVLTCRLGWWIIPLCALAAALLAAAASWISEGKLEELGVFAVALGLALAASRYADAAYLWFWFGKNVEGDRQALAVSMMLETVGWFVVVLAAHLGSRWVIRRLRLTPLVLTDPAEELRRGGLTVVFMVVIAMLLLQILSSGTQLAPIEVGQVYFACAISFYAAAWISYQLTSAHSAAWGSVAVLIVGVAGYAWTAVNPVPSFPGRPDLAELRHFSPTAYGTALPVQMVMVGVVASIFGNWHQRQITRYSLIEDQKLAASMK